MADEYKVVQSPIIPDASLPLPVHFNGIDQPTLDNYVQVSQLPTASLAPIITLTGTTPTINAQNSRIFEIVLTGNTTYSVINAVSAKIFIVRVKQGSGTSYTNTWFSTVTWVTSGATAPVQTTVSNGITTYGFICRVPGTFDGYLLGST